MQKSRTVKIKIKSEAPNEYIRSDQPLLLTHKTAHDTRMHPHTEHIRMNDTIDNFHHKNSSHSRCVRFGTIHKHYSLTIRSLSKYCRVLFVYISQFEPKWIATARKTQSHREHQFSPPNFIISFFILFSFFFVGSIVSLNVDTSTSHIRTQHD